MGAEELAIQYAQDRASAGKCTASATVYGDVGDQVLASVCVDRYGKVQATDREAADAELARREQAQAAGNNALMTEAAQKIDELRAERDNARRVAVTMGNERSRLESILDDLQAGNVALRAENASLRSLLAELTEAAKQHIDCMNFNLPNRGLTQEEWAAREELRAAIEAAKEAVR